MKYKYFTALALSLSVSSVATASTAIEDWQKGLEKSSTPASYACSGRYADDINNSIDNMVPNVCAQLNTDTSLENNPYAYESPQATCDLGLDLPGLPSFDGFEFSMDTPDACGIVKNVIGDFVTDAADKYDTMSTELTGTMTKQIKIDSDAMMGDILDSY